MNGRVTSVPPSIETNLGEVPIKCEEKLLWNISRSDWRYAWGVYSTTLLKKKIGVQNEINEMIQHTYSKRISIRWERLINQTIQRSQAKRRNRFMTFFQFIMNIYILDPSGRFWKETYARRTDSIHWQDCIGASFLNDCVEMDRGSNDFDMGGDMFWEMICFTSLNSYKSITIT